MRKLKSCLFLVLVLILNTIIASLIWYYRDDIYQQPLSYYIFERKVYYLEQTKGVAGEELRYGEKVLVSNPPRTEQNITFAAEYYFWKSLVETPMMEKSERYCYYYAKTKYLNENFKEGEQYDPPYWYAEDNIMDWRNHMYDELGGVLLYLKTNKQGYYRVHILSQGFWWGYPRNTKDKVMQSIHFEDFDEFAKQKKRELGIE